MDPKRFDSLARSVTSWVGHRPSRRSALQFLGGGFVALALSATPEASAKNKKKKKPSRKERLQKKCQAKFGPGVGTFCSGSGCFDLTTDPANCGMCQRACAPGQTCVSGRCTGANTACTPNCAGKACGADDGCNGICTSGSCPGGQTCRSDGACVSGGCNPACGFNSVCQNGACVPAANRCPAPFVCAGFGGDAPVCGRVATPGNVVGYCGCYLSAEGNNVCVNQTDGAGEDLLYSELVPCDSTQQCRETVGFNYFCRAVNTNAQNGLTCGSTTKRCWPTCDAPDVNFREEPQDRAAHDASKRGKSARRKKGRGRKR